MRFIKKIFAHVQKIGLSTKINRSQHLALIIPKEKHPISALHIHKNVVNILSKLQQSGYQAYLVGGSVRDLLLGLKPKDFDIATDAHPEKIYHLFRNSRLIGRRFKLVHIFFGREIIEVATFRAHHPESSHPEGHKSDTGMLLRDNIYGTVEQDAWRRDFSINALYYDHHSRSVIDYTGGIADIEKRQIRILGVADARYQEDPVRMLRAIRFAAKLNFSIEMATEEAIFKHGALLAHVSTARLFDEIIKIFYCGHAKQAFTLLRRYNFFGLLFPQTEAILRSDSIHPAHQLIQRCCANTDARIAAEKSLNPGFLFSVLLWAPYQAYMQQYQAKGYKFYSALRLSIDRVLREQTHTIAITRRFSAIIEEIWSMQQPLEQLQKRRIFGLFSHPRFRAAYDFLLLRSETGETQLLPIVAWWQEFQALDAEKRQEKIRNLKNFPNKKKRKKKARNTTTVAAEKE